MKKLNKKGFVLAEAIVVSVFVLGMFTYLAMNIIPLISKYDAVLNYDNPQEIYSANVLYDEILMLLDRTSKDVKYMSNYIITSDDEKINMNISEETKYFYELLEYLDIKNTYRLEGSCDVIDFSDRPMREYCNYLYSKKGLSEKKNYVIYLVKFNDNKFSHFVVEEGAKNETA